jgi:ubiquinone/menaquinone biosynthesis C-methylase UbiE
MRDLNTEPSRDPEGVEPRFLQDVAGLKGARVLEVGCGQGRLTWRYGREAARVLGVDPQLELLAAAHQSRPGDWTAGVAFVQAQAEHLPFPPLRFDVALLAWSL